MTKTLSIKNASKEIIEKIVQDNKSFEIKANSPHIDHFYKKKNMNISIFKNRTVLLQGEEIDLFAKKYGLKLNENINSIKTTSPNNLTLSKNNIIGNDEVGVGDFFGPLVVSSCFVGIEFKEKYPQLFKKIDDSKKISDEEIINIYNELHDKVIFSVVIIDNERYNDLNDKYNNMHVMKAIGHNEAIYKIMKNNPELRGKEVMIDQFVDRKNYFNYLKDVEKVVKQNIFFETKAESKYIEVACASIIARYHFLHCIKNIEKELGINIPLGAGNNVKLIVQNIKKRKDINPRKYIKMHFNDKIKSKK